MLFAVVGAYLLATPLLDVNMSAQLQLKKFVPQVTKFATNARSFFPGVQKPLTSLNLSSSSKLHSPQQSSFSSTAKMTHDTMTLKDSIKNRRTIYKLIKKSTISDDQIKDILTTAIKDVPSSFNSQSARLVVLVKEEHDKFWQIVEDILRVHVPADKWEHTGNRIAMFKNAYGTVRSHPSTSLLVQS